MSVHVAAATRRQCYSARPEMRPMARVSCVTTRWAFAARKGNDGLFPRGRATARRAKTQCVRAGPPDAPGQPKENEAAIVTLGGGELTSSPHRVWLFHPTRIAPSDSSV